MTSGAPRPLVIILARAGSKGLPGKNITPIAGKPCVQWSIEHAQHAKCAPVVAVSSDAPRVLDLARSLGALALERPPSLASDTARVDDAARCAFEQAAKASHAVSDASPIVVLYANVPVRPLDLLDRAVELLEATRCDSVQSYASVGKYHPWWIARVEPICGACENPTGGRVAPWEGDVLNHGVYRRQDLPPAFIPDGGIIALTHAALFNQIPGVPKGPHAFFGADRRGVINQPGEVIDIDDRIDLLVAEAMLCDRALANPVRRA